MKEVSCRVFEIFLRPLEDKNLSAEFLVAGTSVARSTLMNKHERIDWSEFVAVMQNARQVFTDDEYVEIGRSYFRSPMLRFASTVARLLFTPMDFYRWLTKPRQGVGNQMFTCVTTSLRELSDDRIEIELQIPEGYAMCWDFFVVTKGNLIEMPRLLGAAGAQVELTRIPRGGLYHVVVPRGRAVLSRVRQGLMWPLTLRAAGRELKEAHETLQQRYEQLDLARARLDRQATQLRAANAVSELIHGDLDLDKTLDAITRALVDQAGFDGASVDLETQVDGVRFTRTAHRGGEVGASALARTLEGRGGHPLGELRVAPRTETDRAERDELLAFIAPTVSMALDNAVTYEALEGYHKGLELRVAERTAELTEARDTLAVTVSHLADAKQARDRIFANINHEIRTPLSLILLAVAEGRECASANRDMSSTLETVEHGARRLLRMVDDLLLLAEGREGEIRLDLTACDLAALASGVVDVWTAAARAAGLELTADVSLGCWVKGDRSALERVLSNLLSNAIKFTPVGGRIVVRVAGSADSTLLEVSDNGIGIDEDLRGRLFGRFERGRESIERGIGGSGLGLSLVKELVESHGGTIGVDVLEGGGTLFRVRLPRSASGPLTIAAPQPKLAPADFGMAGPAPKQELYEPPATPRATLLLAEDDPLLRDRIARLLSNEYRVFVASDGLEALRLAELHQPDLLVSDIAMPGIDGIELTKRFRARAGNRVAPVLLLTASGEIRDRLQGFDAGAVDYIVKPFEPAELRARVRSQLALRSIALRLLETEKLVAFGTLTAGLAHEIRNPANGIVNAVGPLREILPADLLVAGSPAAELLDVIDGCSRQIATLSRELLGFRAGAQVDRTQVSLGALLARVRMTAKPLLADIEYRQELEYTGSLPCAEPLMTQVLSNLLDNAAYAAGRGGWIEVRTALEETTVVIEFGDSGPGIPVSLHERIFEPFFTTKPPGSGTGLGLPTAREIVARHGGKLGARERAGRTIFRIEMPMEAT